MDQVDQNIAECKWQDEIYESQENTRPGRRRSITIKLTLAFLTLLTLCIVFLVLLFSKYINGIDAIDMQTTAIIKDIDQIVHIFLHLLDVNHNVTDTI